MKQKNDDLHKIVCDIVNNKDFSPGLKWGVGVKVSKNRSSVTRYPKPETFSDIFAYLNIDYIGVC